MPAGCKFAGSLRLLVRETKKGVVLSMEQKELLENMIGLLEDLGFDYDRMSQAGQATYEAIMEIAFKLQQQ